MQKFLTVQQFADKLGVNRYTIYKRLKKGDIKAVQPGLSWLIPEKEALKWTARKVNVRMRLQKKDPKLLLASEKLKDIIAS